MSNFLHKTKPTRNGWGCAIFTNIFTISVTDTEATLWGKNHESKALETLEKTRNITINQPKKFVPKQYKWMVCIPDGLVVEKDKSGNTCIVEVKCPFRCKDAKLEDVAGTDDDFCLKLWNGKLRLWKNHDYYFQIQGMLNMMNLETCYFGVWTPTEFHSEIVTRDKNVWNTLMFPRLLEFYR